MSEEGRKGTLRSIRKGTDEIISFSKSICATHWPDDFFLRPLNPFDSWFPPEQNKGKSISSVSLSLFFFLLMWTILKAVEFVTILFLFYVVSGGARNVGS